MSEETTKWQQLAEENRRRVEEWLSGGRSRTVRTRGSSVPQVRIRGAAVRTRVTTEDLFRWLATDVPQAAWVVVVDGELDEFANRFCQQAKAQREQSKFWLVESAKIGSAGELPPSFNPIRLNVDKPDDEQLCHNLVADLVIVPSRPAENQEERVRRWLTHCYYLIVEGPTDLRPKDLGLDYPSKQYRAPVFVAEGEQLHFFA